MRGPKPKDYTGVRYGMLEAIKPTGKKDKRGYIWVFRCDCGAIFEAVAADTIGHQKSCGCLKEEKDKKKGIALKEINKKRHERTPGTDVSQLKITKPNRNNKCGYRGIHENNGKYIAKINFMKTQYYLGRYDTESDAAEAYVAAKHRLHMAYVDYIDKKR